MDPSVLRSRLSHADDELHSLTTQDLIECKWAVVHRIFLRLFEKSPCLREYSDRINDLTESRNFELKSQRAAAVGAAPEKRLEWKQGSATFKTNFMRVVIDGLSYLRWPPSLVAFSDPLEKLLSDPKDAIAYILEIGIQKEITRHNRSRKDDPPVSPHSANTSVSIGPGDEKFLQMRTENNSIDTGLATQISINDHHTHCGYQRPTRPQSARRVEVACNSDTKHSIGLESQSQHSLQSDRIKTLQNKDTLPSVADFKQYSHSFEILQHQNEVLSKQLKRLQESVYARDSAEVALGAVLSNFKSQIDEIVNISKPDKNESVYRIPDVSENSSLSPSIDEEFREEVRREKEHEKNLVEDMKNLSGYGKSVTRIKTSASRLKSTDVRSDLAKKIAAERNVPKGTTIIFSKLQEKLVRLEKEWMEARNSITASFSNTIEIPTMCESYLKPKNTQVNRSGNGIGNGNGKCSKNRADSVSNNRGWDGCNNDSSDKKVKSTSSSSASDYLGGVGGGGRRGGGGGEKGGGGVGSGGGGGGGGVACTIRLHQVLGVRPPIAVKGGESIHAENEGSHRHGLDLQRVHLLQRDLLRFSEEAFSFLCCDTDTREKSRNSDNYDEDCRNNGNLNYTDSFPCNTMEAERQIFMLNLFRRAQQLVLHLSCIAPLAPLVLDSPYSSSMTGIEVLERETSNIIPNLPGGSAVKAQAAVRLQGGLDRMRSEQINLLRCLQSSNSMLEQWTTAARKTSPLLTTFTRQSTDTLLTSKQGILDLLDSIVRVTQALEAAEDAKVTLPDALPPLVKHRPSSAVSGKGGIVTLGARLVSPLDSVSHGWLGVEMADLVNTLRMHSADLKRLPEVVEGMKKVQIMDCKASLKEFEEAKKRVQMGAAVTDRAVSNIIASLPS